MGGKIQQVLLLLRCGGKPREILCIDNDVTGRASHDALAGALERLARRPGDVEQPLPRRRVHFLVEGPVSLEETHEGHASSFSCATACAAIRLHASISSCCVVYRPK